VFDSVGNVTSVAEMNIFLICGFSYSMLIVIAVFCQTKLPGYKICLQLRKQKMR
jgi:hypothetical protein